MSSSQTAAGYFSFPSKIPILPNKKVFPDGMGPVNVKKDDDVGFEVLMALSTKIAVFWVLTCCKLIQVYQFFRGPYCFHHQGDESLA
jgi:hypothetical protein